MARLPYVDEAKVPHDIRQLLEELPKLNLFRMAAHAETVFPGIITLGAAILGRLELDGALRELVILQTARCIDAEYEWNQHADAARAVGVTQGQLDSLARGVDTGEHFSEREICALAVAKCLALTNDIPDNLMESASAQFPSRQLVELAIVVGFYRMLGALLKGFRVDLDTPDGAGLLEYSAYSAGR